MDNQVVQGDCLEALAALPDGCADLVYADPPFATGRDFGAFDDRWEDGLDGFLSYMRPRLAAARRVLSGAGSFWVHSDWRAGSYLRVMLDEIFGRRLFRNEIAWCYAPNGQPPARSFHRKHDTILFYADPDVGVWNRQFTEPAEATRRAYSTCRDVDGRLYGTAHGVRVYLDEYQGRAMPDWWVDIPNGASGSNRDRGLYPTQKPVGLLERIIGAATVEDDLVVDPFCGSGTALVAAKRLGRRWWGCDLNPEAVRLAESRLAAVTAPLAGLAV